MEWIAIAISVITLLGSIGGIVWALGRRDAKLEQLGLEIKEMSTRIGKVEHDVVTVSANLATHRENTARHRDPERDERTHNEMMARFDKLETMIMRAIDKNQ